MAQGVFASTPFEPSLNGQGRGSRGERVARCGGAPFGMASKASVRRALAVDSQVGRRTKGASSLMTVTAQASRQHRCPLLKRRGVYVGVGEHDSERTTGRRSDGTGGKPTTVSHLRCSRTNRCGRYGRQRTQQRRARKTLAHVDLTVRSLLPCGCSQRSRRQGGVKQLASAVGGITPTPQFVRSSHSRAEPFGGTS